MTHFWIFCNLPSTPNHQQPTMAKCYKDYEKRINEALCAWRHDGTRSIRSIAQEFAVDRKTFGRRLRGEASESTRSAINKRLTAEQEQAICDYIERLDRIDLSAKLSTIGGAANFLLIQRADPSNLPSPSQREMGQTFRFTAFSIFQTQAKAIGRWKKQCERYSYYYQPFRSFSSREKGPKDCGRRHMEYGRNRVQNWLRKSSLGGFFISSKSFAVGGSR